ncbi:hypothetical protein [Nonomuraea sp. NPDC049646]|uniref:hypothetical protein n=1 Tax=unclassified Nonomuraea TaxID=2593643 RepID=UPI00378CADB7
MKRRHTPRGIQIQMEHGETLSQRIACILAIIDARRWNGAARVKSEYHRRHR